MRQQRQCPRGVHRSLAHCLIAPLVIAMVGCGSRAQDNPAADGLASSLMPSDTHDTRQSTGPTVNSGTDLSGGANEASSDSLSDGSIAGANSQVQKPAKLPELAVPVARFEELHEPSGEYDMAALWGILHIVDGCVYIEDFYKLYSDYVDPREPTTWVLSLPRGSVFHDPSIRQLWYW